MNIRKLTLFAIGIVPVALAPELGLAKTITEIIDATGDGMNPLRSPLGIAVDASGNVYVTGDSSENTFKITPVVGRPLKGVRRSQGTTLLERRANRLAPSWCIGCDRIKG